MATTPATTDAATAVERFMLLTHNPEALVDHEAVQQLEKQLAESTAALERLTIRSKLLEAAQPDTETIEQGFIDHAKPWAEQAGVAWQAFLDEGVPKDILQRAGFDVPTRGTRRSTPAARTGQPAKTVVTQKEIEKHIPATEPFSVAKLMELSGGGNAPTRALIKRLTEEGALVEIGPDPDHSGPGMAPTIWRKAS